MFLIKFSWDCFETKFSTFITGKSRLYPTYSISSSEAEESPLHRGGLYNLPYQSPARSQHPHQHPTTLQGSTISATPNVVKPTTTKSHQTQSSAQFNQQIASSLFYQQYQNQQIKSYPVSYKTSAGGLSETPSSSTDYGSQATYTDTEITSSFAANGGSSTGCENGALLNNGMLHVHFYYILVLKIS